MDYEDDKGSDRILLGPIPAADEVKILRDAMRLQLRPRDVLVLSTPTRVDMETLKRLKGYLEQAFPDHKAVVLGDGLQLGAVAPALGPVLARIQQAMGAASMCWIPRPEGQFDSASALAEADLLLDFLRPLLREPGEPAPIDMCRELREALGIPAGALATAPAVAWREAIERVRNVVRARGDLLSAGEWVEWVISAQGRGRSGAEVTQESLTGAAEAQAQAAATGDPMLRELADQLRHALGIQRPTDLSPRAAWMSALERVRQLAEIPRAAAAPAADGPGWIVVPVCRRFDSLDAIGTLRIRADAVPPTGDFVFAIGYLQTAGEPIRLNEVSLVSDADYLAFLKRDEKPRG